MAEKSKSLTREQKQPLPAEPSLPVAWTAKMKQIESERLKKIQDKIYLLKAEGSSWDIMSKELDCSLKQLVRLLQVRFTYECFGGKSFYDAFLENNRNDQITYQDYVKPGRENAALKYFLSDEEATEEQVKQWPYSFEVMTSNMRHRTLNPGTFIPETVQYKEVHTDFYVSPKMVYRNIKSKGSGFTFCDNFRVHTLVTMTETAPNKVLYKVNQRCEILKSTIVADGVLLSNT